MRTAAALRDAGQDATIAADVAAHKGYGDYIRQAIELLATRVNPEPWTCDEVRSLAEFVAASDGSDFRPSDNLLPALIGVAVGKGQIVRQPRDATSGRRSRRSSRVGRYLGAKYATP